ncbi:MATE family efflux transporter [Dyella choica]|uniref:Uncharacterized protein n=1 Tax=Dyella choica TaxID=1927959 RepID=A0A3S0RLV6_9GAMM|nr:MATE family efflux transporter [Dyella choica]RUL77680.1 hypothetical protein EKH80_07365 [Dyella choica]
MHVSPIADWFGAWLAPALPAASFVNEYGPTEAMVGCGLSRPPDPAKLPRLKKGVILGVSAGILNFGNAAFIWVIAGLGSMALAANSINLTVSYLGFIPVLGLPIGCSVLCSNAIDKNNFAQIPRIVPITC